MNIKVKYVLFVAWVLLALFAILGAVTPFIRGDEFSITNLLVLMGIAYIASDSSLRIFRWAKKSKQIE